MKLELARAHNIQGDAHCGITPIYRSAPVFIFDIDGTIALTPPGEHISADPATYDWSKFNELCKTAAPHTPVIQVMQALYENGSIIRLFTSRSRSCGEISVDWLNRHDAPFHSLHMREEGDCTPDFELKRHWLEHYRGVGEGRRIACAYEDRSRVVQMYRDNGVPCMQAAPGDF